MKTFLCVAEKPSVAKTASKILSKDNFRVEPAYDKHIKNNFFQCSFQNEEVNVIFTSVKGHLYELEFLNEIKDWNKEDPYNLFSSEITWRQKSFQIHSNLNKLSKESDYLMLWLDNDLEGEKISEDVEQVCLQSNPNLIVKRCRFSALSESDLFQAFNNPSEINRADSMAVKLRIETDLRVGSAFTRFQTNQLKSTIESIKHKHLYGQKKVISYGTCQFPTLGFIVEAYNENKNYISEPFWYINTIIEKDGMMPELKWIRKKLFCKLSCFAIYSSILSNPIGQVVDIEIKRKYKRKPLPLTTVILQKKASKYFNIDPFETMRITERLYTKGYISYSRTETDSYPQTFNYNEVIQALQKSYDRSISSYATNLVFESPIQGSHADNAHPPIYPIKVPENLKENEMKMFDYISRHFLASVSKSAIGENRKVYFNIGDEIFTLKGFRIIEKNFLDIYPYSVWSCKTIPNFTMGETIAIKSIKMFEGKTDAPSFISEPHLIKRMNKEGIGTDATIADIIKKITDRNFTYKKNGLYIPTDIGLALINGYKKMGFDFDKPDMRADLEKTMQKVSKNPEVFDDEKNRIISEYENAYKKALENVSILKDSIEEQMRLRYEKKFKSRKHLAGKRNRLRIKKNRLYILRRMKKL